MPNTCQTHHFQMFVKDAIKPEAFAQAVYIAIFPPTEPGMPHPAAYPFKVLEEIKWEDRGQVWDDILGEYNYKGVRLEVTFDRTSRNVTTWKIAGKGIDVGPISVGSSEYKLVAPGPIAHRLLTAFVRHLLTGQNPEVRLKYLLSNEDPDLTHSRVYQTFSGNNLEDGIKLAERYIEDMPEYEVTILKNVAYHLQLKNPSVALEYHHRGLKRAMAARGPGALSEYSRDILKAHLALHNLSAATAWANECCADPHLIDFYKAELCIELYAYIEYNRKKDADLADQLRHWANRCVNEFKSTRLQRALSELEKAGRDAD